MDQLVLLQNRVYDLPESWEPRMSQAIFPGELPPVDRTVRCDSAAVDQGRRRNRRADYRTNTAPECHVIGKVSAAPGPQDRVYERFVDTLVVVAAGEVHRHSNITRYTFAQVRSATALQHEQVNSRTWRLASSMISSTAQMLPASAWTRR